MLAEEPRSAELFTVISGCLAHACREQDFLTLFSSLKIMESSHHGHCGFILHGLLNPYVSKTQEYTTPHSGAFLHSETMLSEWCYPSPSFNPLLIPIAVILSPKFYSE